MLKSVALNKNRVVLLEVGGSHEECLLTQINALKAANKEVILIIDEQIAQRSEFLLEAVEDVRVIPTDMGTNRQKANHLFRILKILNPEKVVFNTAQGTIVRNLSFKLRFTSIQCYGIIHTVRKFTESFTQKYISKKIRNYLFLSEYLMQQCPPKKGLQLDYFYPVDFPFRSESAPQKSVVIIGGVEKRRKDLEGAVQLIAQTEGYQFIFLGKSDAENADVIAFKEHLGSEGLSDRVLLYNDFVDHEEFNRVVSRASFLLPLVHPDTASAEQYFINQISGAMTVAFGYSVPLLLHDHYTTIKEMNVAAFYYKMDTFQMDFENAVKERPEKIAQILSNEYYSPGWNRERFIHFLGY